MVLKLKLFSFRVNLALLLGFLGEGQKEKFCPFLRTVLALLGRRGEAGLVPAAGERYSFLPLDPEHLSPPSSASVSCQTLPPLPSLPLPPFPPL